MVYVLCRQTGRSGPRILLIHGFGVGSFQFIPLMEQLAVDHQVWALDLLGQGLSWPSAEALAGVPNWSYNLLLTAWQSHLCLLTSCATNVSCSCSV